MKTTTQKPRLSMEEVREAIDQQIPDLAEHLQEDRDWLWYCGPSLQGEANRPIREALKEIGFRFAPGGHVMPDGRQGSWGHSCHRPMFNKHKARHRFASKDEVPDPLAQLAAMGF